MSKQSKKKNTFLSFLKFILVVLLLLGLAGIVVRFVSCDDDIITGMYIKYDDGVITSDNDGIAVDYYETETLTLSIVNEDGWGIYDVTGCTVKVVNNVSADSEHNFEYVVNGANLPSEFSDITDFTSLFTSDGGDITVNSDGTFEIVFNYFTMSALLQAYHGKEVTLYSDISLNNCAYFAIQIISPDESETITIPFTYHFVAVEWIVLSGSNIYF